MAKMDSEDCCCTWELFQALGISDRSFLALKGEGRERDRFQAGVRPTASTHWWLQKIVASPKPSVSTRGS